MQPPELFDVSFSKRLFRLCGRHLFWVEFHQLGHTGAFAGSGSSALGESVSVHNGAVISLMGLCGVPAAWSVHHTGRQGCCPGKERVRPESLARFDSILAFCCSVGAGHGKLL